MWNRLSTVLLCLLFAWGCLAQTTTPTYTVQTFAGSAPMGDGGAAVSAVLRFPNAVAFDSVGNLYIADQGNSSIRIVSTGGIISTVTGTGVSGFSGDGGPANQAQLGGTISGLVIDNAGNIFISDSANHRVREVAKADGNIYTVVSSSNLPAMSASFWPNGLALDNKGNLYVADDHNSQVYVMTASGSVSVFAGIGKAGDSGDEGPAAAAALVEPFGVFADVAGVVYIADISASRVRKVTPDGMIHAFAGTGQAGMGGDGGPAAQALLAQPMHVVGDHAGNLYVADHCPGNRNIRMITPNGMISTIAGGPNPNGVIGGDGGPASIALIQAANGVAVSPSGDLYFSDSDSAVRVVSQGMINTFAGYRHFAGEDNPAPQALMNMPSGVAVDPLGNVYVADTNNFRVRQIGMYGTMQQQPGRRRRDQPIQIPNAIWTIAGTGQCGQTGDGGVAISASMTRPLALAIDTAQNLYLGFNGRVRLITAGGIISTIAGGGTSMMDGVPARYTSLGKINGIAVDASGVIYLADTDNNMIRKITTDGLIHTIAGTGAAGNSGDGLQAIAAQLNGPTNLALDSIGNVYFSDTGNSRVRMIRTDGTMVTFAGTGQVGETGDGGLATAARLASPDGNCRG